MGPGPGSSVLFDNFFHSSLSLSLQRTSTSISQVKKLRQTETIYPADSIVQLPKAKTQGISRFLFFLTPSFTFVPTWQFHHFVPMWSFKLMVQGTSKAMVSVLALGSVAPPSPYKVLPPLTQASPSSSNHCLECYLPYSPVEERSPPPSLPQYCFFSILPPWA